MMFFFCFRKTLLNGKELSLTHGSLPTLTPLVQSTSLNMSVRVPARSVFFIVLPLAGARACLTPSALSRREELANPQWEQWQNMKSLISTVGPHGDFIFERGGIYESSENLKNNGGALVNSKDYDKTEVEEKRILGEKQSINNFNKKLKSLSQADTLPDTSKIKTSDNALRTGLLTNKGLQEEYSNTEIKNTIISMKNKSEATISELHENMKLENTRVKRSDVSNSGKNTNYLPEVEISPLYRKLHHMQSSRQADNTNSNSVLKSLSLGNFKPVFQTNKTITKKLYQPSKETEMNQKNIHYDNLLKLKETLTKNNTASNLLNSPVKEDTDFHYHPGAFYETLGNLKIDSNLSLADIEEQHEDFAVMLKESAKCEDCKSSLQVTKRPANQGELDRKIVENKTEYIEQYLKNTEDFKKHNSLGGSNKSTNDEIEHSSGEKKGEEGKVYKSKTLADNNNARDDTSHNLSSKKSFIGGKRPEVLSLQTLERIKRDTESYKYISQIFNKNVSDELSDNNSTNMSHPGEMQLRMFLQELTEEGEDILKSFDDKYEQQFNKPNHTEQNRFDVSVLSPVSNKSIGENGDKQNSTVDKGSKIDFYLENNLITNHTTKPKKNYNSTKHENFYYNSKNISNTHKVQNPVKTKNTMLQPIGDIDKSTENFSTLIPLKLGELSSTDSTHDINSYSKPTLPHEEISNPNQNSFHYSLTPKPYSFFFKSYENPILNHESNPEEINNPGTLITSKMVLKPFQEDRIILPTAKTFIPLKIDELDRESLTESNTDANLFLKITLPNVEVSKSNKNLSPHPVSSKLFQQPLFKDHSNLKVDQDSKVDIPSNPESTMSSQIIDKYLQREIKTLPIQASGNLDENSDTDVKESMIISTLSGMPRVKNSFFGMDPPESESNDREENKDQLNPARNIKSQDETVKTFLQENQNTNKPTYFQTTLSNVQNLNKTQGLLGSIREINSPVTNMFLKKQKERLEAFKERLAKARERLQNFSQIHPTPNFPTIKLSNDHTKSMISDLERNNDMNREDILKKPNQHSLVAVESKMSVKKQLHSNDTPLPSDSSPTNRRKRQTSNVETEEQELTKMNSAKLETPASVQLINDESLADIVIESSSTPIRKWIIPLSNHTEKIVMKNKIFPVKLFGVLSDGWQNQIKKKDDSVKDSERKPRSVLYSCMRDNFDDYSAESGNVDGIKVGKDTKQLYLPEVSHPSLLSNDNLAEKNPVLLSSPHDYNRKKRTVSSEAIVNKFDSLVNEIKKEGPSNKVSTEGVSNDISDHEPNNNIFSTMLQKQVAAVMKNKTGLDRMFDLANLYQKTNPTSLEILKNYGTVKNTGFQTDNNGEENKAMEVPDSEETDIIPESREQNNLKVFIGQLNDTEKLLSNQQNTSVTTTKNNPPNESSNTSNKNIFSILMGNIKVLFKKVNTVFRKFLKNVKPLKPA